MINWTERRLLIDEQARILFWTIPTIVAKMDVWDIRLLAARMVDTAIARSHPMR